MLTRAPAFISATSSRFVNFYSSSQFSASTWHCTGLAEAIRKWRNYAINSRAADVTSVWIGWYSDNSALLQKPDVFLRVETHSLTHWTAWRRWVVAPPRRRDHQPCSKQHLQWAQHRSPAGGSRFVGDDLEDVFMPVCHQVGDRHGRWQPDEVLHVRVLILADDVRVRILRFVCLGFCCGCFVAGSGSLLAIVETRRLLEVLLCDAICLSLSLPIADILSLLLNATCICHAPCCNNFVRLMNIHPAERFSVFCRVRVYPNSERHDCLTVTSGNTMTLYLRSWIRRQSIVQHRYRCGNCQVSWCN